MRPWVLWALFLFSSLGSISSAKKKGTKYSPVVCWKPQRNSEQSLGLEAFGPGCSRCDVGDTCTFSIAAVPPTALLDMEVLISGPSLHAGRVAPISGLNSRLLVSYRIWDQGTYRVSLRSACASKATNASETDKAHADADSESEVAELAHWKLQVGKGDQSQGTKLPRRRLLFAAPASPAAALLGNPRGQGQVHGGAASGGARDATPCEAGQYGRWLRRKSGKGYRWTPYGCAGRTLRRSLWVAALNKRGIREINFIGSTPQRLLMLHLNYLLTGRVDESHRNAEYSFSYVVHGPGEQGQEGKGRLQLNFYWVGGMHHGDNKFGCRSSKKARFAHELPLPSSTANVWLLEAGHWTGEHCSSPEAALATYLPHFLMWARRRVDAAVARKRRMPAWYLQAEAQASREPFLVYRPTPPKPTTAKQACGKASSKNYVLAANSIERGLLANFDAVLFDSYEIEAARIADHCPGSSQFSCVREVPDRQKQFYVSGDVGEADAYAFVQFLLKH